MLRALVLLLLVANGLFFAWSRGWLGDAGPGGREPERMARQVNPDAVRVLNPSAATAALASTPAPSVRPRRRRPSRRWRRGCQPAAGRA
jgi:hypothetical protein